MTGDERRGFEPNQLESEQSKLDEPDQSEPKSDQSEPKSDQSEPKSSDQPSVSEPESNPYNPSPQSTADPFEIPKAYRNREPICGFCWARRNVRQPLEYKVKWQWWECPLCLAKTRNPIDEDDEHEVRDIFDSDPNRWALTLASTRRLKGSGNKSCGRKRRNKKKLLVKIRPEDEDKNISKFGALLKRRNNGRNRSVWTRTKKGRKN